MFKKLGCLIGASLFMSALAAGADAQSQTTPAAQPARTPQPSAQPAAAAKPTANANANASAQRAPSKPARAFVVRTAQSLSELEAALKPENNKVEDLIGGQGMQLRVAVQHERGREGAAAEVHDASDDVYYVLDGSATLTLGGALESPREDTPGEWRAQRITGGQTVEINKGDLVVVPRGTPHQRSTAGKDFTMILIKIFAEPLPAPKPAAAPAAKPKP